MRVDAKSIINDALMHEFGDYPLLTYSPRKCFSSEVPCDDVTGDSAASTLNSLIASVKQTIASESASASSTIGCRFKVVDDCEEPEYVRVILYVGPVST